MEGGESLASRSADGYSLGEPSTTTSLVALAESGETGGGREGLQMLSGATARTTLGEATRPLLGGLRLATSATTLATTSEFLLVVAEGADGRVLVSSD